MCLYTRFINYPIIFEIPIDNIIHLWYNYIVTRYIVL